MKKKILVLLITLVFVISGCGKDDTDKKESEGSVAESEPQSESSQLGNTGMPGSEAEGGYNEEVALEYLKDAVVDVLGDNYWPDMMIPADMLEGTYGVKPDMYDEYFGECPMISVNVDTLIIVKAKEGEVENVKKALEDYREKSISESMQYPQNLGKIQASRIEIFQEYVCFVQLGADTTEASDVGEEAVVEQCLEENERALDAIEKALLK